MNDIEYWNNVDWDNDIQEIKHALEAKDYNKIEIKGIFEIFSKYLLYGLNDTITKYKINAYKIEALKNEIHKLKQTIASNEQKIVIDLLKSTYSDDEE